MAEFQEMVNQLFNPRVAKSRKKTLFGTLDEWGLESLDPFAGANNKSPQYDMNGGSLDAPNEIKRERLRRATESLKAGKQSPVSRLMQDDVPTQRKDIPINKRELIPMPDEEPQPGNGERPRIVGQEPEPTVKPRSKVADKLRAIQNAPVKDYSKYKKVKDAMGDVVLNDDGTPVLETDAEGKPVKKSQWKRFAQGFKNFAAAMGEGQGMGAALLTATTDPTFDERREKQTAFNTMLQKYQVEQQIENDQLNEDVKRNQIRNSERDDERNAYQFEERQTNAALSKLVGLQHFDPADPTHAALAKQARLNPEALRGWDDRNPIFKKVNGVTYKFDRQSGKFLAEGSLPKDATVDVKVDVYDESGARVVKTETYTMPEAQAARFVQQQETFKRRAYLQAQTKQDDRAYREGQSDKNKANRIALDQYKENLKQAKKAVEDAKTPEQKQAAKKTLADVLGQRPQ